MTQHFIEQFRDRVMSLPLPKTEIKNLMNHILNLKNTISGEVGIMVKQFDNNTHWYSYFCGNECFNQFVNSNLERVIAIAPRTEALETPILDPTKERPYEQAQWFNWQIKVDESRQR